MDDKKLKTVPLNKIKISDQFWNRYIHLVKDVLIPYQWDILNDRLPDVETSHCIENFKIAAGETDGDFEGAVFQDTDVAKWLEAVAYSLAAEPDEHLSYLADKTINLIGRAQCEDGYLNTYFTIKDPSKRWTNLKEGHELYTAGHMTEAAVAYYKATGKTEFLDIMKKFADLICKTFGPDEGQIHGYPGHQEIELALIRLYHVTGEKKYLETAKYFIDTRGVGENYFLEEEKRPEYKQIFPEFAGYDPRYSQSHEPVREQKTAEGHAVRAVYMYCAMADLAYEYKDKELLDACKTLWEDMTKRQMYITGSIGASGLLERFTTDYDLPNNCNYSETCASIGLALFGRRMAQITKDASYMDVVERALYNTLLSGIAQDGKSFFYVNPLEVWPDNCIDRTSKEHVKPVRQKWFGVACCPPNIARTLASMGQYIYFIDKNTAYVNLYISNALAVGLMLITLLKHADRVKIACLAQLVNVIAPIMTDQGGGAAWKQTIFYPFLHASKYGRGVALMPLVQTTKHDTAKHENVTDVESVAVYNEEKEELTIFAVNRTLEDDIELTTDLRGMEGFHLVEHIVMEESDLKLVNSSYEEKVVPKTVNRSKMDGGIMTTLLGKASWNVIRLSK